MQVLNSRIIVVHTVREINIKLLGRSVLHLISTETWSEVIPLLHYERQGRGKGCVQYRYSSYLVQNINNNHWKGQQHTLVRNTVRSCWKYSMCKKRLGFATPRALACVSGRN